MGAADTIISIDARFNGPPTSANGGYACGLLARHLDGPAEVTLHVPPPLERPLTVVAHEATLQLHDGDTLVAVAEPTTVEAHPPAIVSLADAERAVHGFPGFADHAFPMCFVCGPHRSPGDGLRLFAGPVPGTPVSATPWTPPADLADADGHVAVEVVWAALDCPSYFGGVTAGSVTVLGRLAADVRAPIRAGGPHVVLGWPRGAEGRKHHAAAAVLSADGDVLAVSTATWIELRQPHPSSE